MREERGGLDLFKDYTLSKKNNQPIKILRVMSGWAEMS